MEFYSIIIFRGATESLTSIIRSPLTLREVEKFHKFLRAVERHLEENNSESRLEAMVQLQTENCIADEGYIEKYEAIASGVDAVMKVGCRRLVVLAAGRP